MEFINKYKWIILIIIIFLILFFVWRENSKTDDHIINSLYKSDNRIYNEKLNEKEKMMYDLILDSLVKHHYNLNIDMDKYHCSSYSGCSSYVTTAHYALMTDHPELMNYSGLKWTYGNEKFTLTLKPAYYLSLKDYYGVWVIESILAKIEKETKGLDDQEKIIYVYNWIGEHNTYDEIFMYASKNQSIYSVFIEKNAVCAGFAKASQIIFSRIGIESYIVIGHVGENGDNAHMWNTIKYEDHYYYFDSTIAVCRDEKSENYYDGLKQNYMSQYVPQYTDWSPVVETKNMFDE